MEVHVGGEALRKQLGADHLPVVHDQAAFGLVRKGQVRQPGHQQRIRNAKQDRCHKGESNGRSPNRMRHLSLLRMRLVQSRMGSNLFVNRCR